MVSATVITYSEAAPSDRDAARHLAGPVVPTLVKFWRDTYGSLPETYFLLVHQEGANDSGQAGPVRRLNPAVFAKGSGAVPVACTMTDDPDAEQSKYCVWRLGSDADATTTRRP
jgi:hypothetical protein